MNRFAQAGCLLLLLATPTGFLGQPPDLKLNQVKVNGHVFTLPPGFTIELVAGPPLVNRPITASFDEEGRLYVSDSSGSNENVQEQLKKKPHRIVRLEDSKGTGKFDKATVFADKMMFPEGTLWHNGSLYVAAPPSIWKLTDTDGDGIADQRVEWFKGKTLTGCANDLHGPYLGPDGWIYWCKGAFAKQSYELPGGKKLNTRASHIFARGLMELGVEPVMTGGMDNPVGLAFTPEGERIFSCTFFQYPGGGKRDGLVHALYGGVYGKDHDVIYEHPWTGPSYLPPMTHLGPAAPAGMIRYESAALGKEYQNNLFVSCFNLQKVTRHVLKPKGATFETTDSDFVVSDNKDFHPTDVVEDADGSLLVIDTGGWYKLCCPSSQLVKPDVLGAIYRVRRVDAPKMEDPRGLMLAWDKDPKLLDRLGDSRPAVRRRAIETIATPGNLYLRSLEIRLGTDPNPETRRNIVWIAARIQNNSALRLLEFALKDRDDTVRQAALHALSVGRFQAPALGVGFSVPTLVREQLSDKNPAIRRAAAEALGRLGDKYAVPQLLGAFSEEPDRALEHSLTYAVIEIGNEKSAAAGLKSDNPGTRRAALTALDQMGVKLDAATLLPDLASTDPALKETAWWIAGRHPEWGGALKDFLRTRLNDPKLAAADRDELAKHLAKFAKSPAIQDVLADGLKNPQAQGVAIQAMRQAGLKQPPAAWLNGLADLLNKNDPKATSEVLPALRALTVPKQSSGQLVAGLFKVARDVKNPPAERLQALGLIPGKLTLDDGLFELARAHLGREQEPALRALAVEVISHSSINPDQALSLASALKHVGPMEINRVIEALPSTKDDRLGKAIVEALAASPAKSALHVDVVKQRLAGYGKEVQKEADNLYASLNKDASEQRQKLEAILTLTSLEKGDVRHGMIVFNSPRAACSTCHAIGYVGGTLGPDLTHIGKIRTDRDLLEAIAFPNLSFVRGYEPVVVTTKDGKIHNGVLKKDAPDEVVLARAPHQEVRLARADIETIQPSQVSVMPSGLDQQLTPRELADLVAFLKANK